MRAKDVILVLGGAIVGAGIALLTAPESGERTRRRIKRIYEDERDRMVDTYQNVREDLEDGAKQLGRKFKKHTR